MDLLLTLFRRDFRALPRRSGFYWSRAGFAVAAGLLVLAAFCLSLFMPRQVAGLPVFLALTILVTVFACLLSPYLGMNSLAQERRHHLLGLLIITEMRSRHIILGKLLASIGNTLMIMLVVLPLFLLCVSLGGVSVQQILLANLLLLCTVILGTSLGLAVGAAAFEESSALTWLAIATIILFVVVPLAPLLLDELGWDAAKYSTHSSPLLTMLDVNAGAKAESIFKACGTLVGMAAVLLAVALYLLPRFVVRHQEKRQTVTPFSRYARNVPVLGMRISLRRWFPNPLTWREYQFVHGDTGTVWLRFFAVLMLSAAIAVGVLHYSGAYTAIEISVLTLSLVGQLSGLAGMIVFTIGTTRMFNRERQEGTIEPLLCTALSDRDIIRAKLQALYLTMLPWVIAIVVANVMSALLLKFTLDMLSAPTLFWILLLWNIFSTFWWLVTLYGYSGFCMYAALRYKHPTLLSAIVLFLWLTVGQVLLLALAVIFTFSTAIFGVLLPLLAPVLAGLIFRAKLRREFRRYILTPTD